MVMLDLYLKKGINEGLNLPRCILYSWNQSSIQVLKMQANLTTQSDSNITVALPSVALSFVLQ